MVCDYIYAYGRTFSLPKDVKNSYRELKMKDTRSKSIAVNAVLNGSKTIITILFPLIIFPYVTRVLSVDNLGKVSYAQSIISYFALIAGLGINTYAVREGAKIRDNKIELRKFSNQVFTISLVSTIISYILLIALLLSMRLFDEYSSLLLILASSIIFTTIGIEWMNSIFEDYLYITIRTLIVQILHLVLVFILIKEKDDYTKYASLIALSQILIGTSNFFYCRRYCRVSLTKHMNISKHIKPMLILFANTVAVTLYCNADSTMLGLMTSDYYVGIYAVAVKVFSMVRSLLAALLLVSIPRLSFYIGEKNKEKAKKLVSSITQSMVLLLFPAVVGLICLAKPIILLLSGNEYIEAIMTLRILSIALGFAIIGGIVTNCINIPTGREKANLEGTVIAALINIVLNIFVLPKWKQNGAAVTTVIAELVVIVYCVIKNKDIYSYFEWKAILKSLLHASIGCMFIVLTTVIVNYCIDNMIIACALTLIISVISYAIFLLVIKDQMATRTVEKLVNKLNKH